MMRNDSSSPDQSQFDSKYHHVQCIIKALCDMHLVGDATILVDTL